MFRKKNLRRLLICLLLAALTLSPCLPGAPGPSMDVSMEVPTPAVTAQAAVKTGFVQKGGRLYYYRNGKAVTGWQRIGNDLYYFFKSNKYGHVKGAAAMGSHTIDNVKYSFRKKKAGSHPAGSLVTDGALPGLIASSGAARKTSQIVLVLGHKLTVWDRSGSSWKQAPILSYCGYGQKGLKEAARRKAGDRTTPIGAFPLTLAFGRGSNPGTKLPYRKITKNSWWSCTRAAYNCWVEKKKTSGEHLIDYYQYKYAMVIGFNMNPAVYGRGSGIFLHCRSTDHWYTAGCVGVPESVMLSLMKYVKKGAYIVIVPNTAGLKKV